MTLPHDVSRCAGRLSDGLCPRRATCERYLDLLALPDNEPVWVPVSTGLCRENDDFYIGAGDE